LERSSNIAQVFVRCALNNKLRPECMRMLFCRYFPLWNVISDAQEFNR
jgi:hypothetical protein